MPPTPPSQLQLLLVLLLLQVFLPLLLLLLPTLLVPLQKQQQRLQGPGRAGAGSKVRRVPPPAVDGSRVCPGGQQRGDASGVPPRGRQEQRGDASAGAGLQGGREEHDGRRRGRGREIRGLGREGRRRSVGGGGKCLLLLQLFFFLLFRRCRCRRGEGGLVCSRQGHDRAVEHLEAAPSCGV